jgi:plastocyanin
MKKLLFSIFTSILCLFGYSQTTYDVNSGNFYYQPDTIVINLGESVHWVNDGGFHNVNFDVNTVTSLSYNNPESFESVPTSDVDIYTHTFTIPGTYNYDCSVGAHAASGMIGTVIVNPSSNSITENDLINNSFNAYFITQTNAIQLEFNSGNLSSNAVVKIYNLEGKCVQQKPITTKRGKNSTILDINSSINKGVYVVTLVLDNITISKKVALY